VRLSFHAQRSADVLYVLRPYHMHTGDRTTHGTPWTYDTHVPLIFLGHGVRAGHHHRRVSPAAIAPTLAHLLQIDAPAACEEQPLEELAGRE
jgi:hypothetical protein